MFEVAASKNVRMWLTKVRKIKSIYHTLNLFNIDVTQKCLIAEVWCPINELERIKMALKRGTVNIAIPSLHTFINFRKKVEVKFHLSSIAWRRLPIHQLIIKLTSLLRPSRTLWMHTVSLRIEKSIQVNFIMIIFIYSLF